MASQAAFKNLSELELFHSWYPYMRSELLSSGSQNLNFFFSQELSENESEVDLRNIGSIVCDSFITSLLYWQGKLFVGLSNKEIKVPINYLSLLFLLVIIDCLFLQKRKKKREKRSKWLPFDAFYRMPFLCSSYFCCLDSRRFAFLICLNLLRWLVLRCTINLNLLRLLLRLSHLDRIPCFRHFTRIKYDYPFRWLEICTWMAYYGFLSCITIKI